jgi:hypothetical protein
MDKKYNQEQNNLIPLAKELIINYCKAKGYTNQIIDNGKHSLDMALNIVSSYDFAKYLYEQTEVDTKPFFDNGILVKNQGISFPYYIEQYRLNSIFRIVCKELILSGELGIIINNP